MSMTWKELKGKDPIWCPGCGDFGVLRALQQAVADTGRPAHEHALVTGIGCSGTITGYIRTYGFHGIHGRALPAATGIKLANPELNVIVAGGDGDGFGIGLGHFMHAARRNIDVTYIVMDNQVYGLTKGQTSPTTDPDMTTKASPAGPMAAPVAPLELAMAAGAGFVAQGFSGDMKGLVDLIRRGMAHKGFAIINVQSPCVTYNQLNTFAWFKEHMRTVAHDPSDRAAALAVAHDHSVVPIGLIYQDERPDLGRHFPVQEPGIVADAADPAGAVARQAERFTRWQSAFQVR